MRARSLQIFFRRKMSRKVGERGQFLISLFLGLSLAFFLIHCFDSFLRPQLVTLATAEVQNRITHIADLSVSTVVADQSISHSDLAAFQSEPDGAVTALTIDTVRLNTFRALLLEEIITQAESIDDHSLKIPFGALTGIDLFSALGPSFPIRVVSVASAVGSYRNEFTDAGINQTLHRILLDISVTASLLLPGGIVDVQVAVPVCITETVIIGQIPQTFLQLPSTHQ